MFVKLYFALRQVDFFVKANQNKCVAKALLLLVDASMNKHFVAIDQRGDMALPWRGLVARVCEWLQLGPYLVGDVELVEIIVTLVVNAATKQENLVQETNARVRVARLRSLSHYAFPFEQVLLWRVELQNALVERVEVRGAAAFVVSAAKQEELVVNKHARVAVSFLRQY